MACYKYLTDEEAIRQIYQCEQRGVRILGIDVFTKTDAMTKPHLDKTLDLSKLRDIMKSAALARNHVDRLIGRGLHFEVVADE